MDHSNDTRNPYFDGAIILTPYGLFTCAVNNTKSEAMVVVLTGGGNVSFRLVGLLLSGKGDVAIATCCSVCCEGIPSWGLG